MYYYKSQNSVHSYGGYYYKSQNSVHSYGGYYYHSGSGLFDSVINAVTSQVAKEVATNAAKKVAEKTLTEVGNRSTQKIIDKIIPPKKGKGSSDKTKEIYARYATPIEEFVKK